MVNQIHITQDEITQVLHPIIDQLKGATLDPIGIDAFQHATKMAFFNVKIAMDNLKSGRLSDRDVMLDAADRAIAKAIILRVMLERPEEEIYQKDGRFG